MAHRPTVSEPATYLGMNMNSTIGIVTISSAQNQSLVAQNTIGRMHSPVVQPMHCIIEMWPRRSLQTMQNNTKKR